MKMLSTFASVGWDFVNNWDIVVNNTYPYLRGMPQFQGGITINDPPEPEIPTEEDIPDINAPPNKDKLIVLVHGWSRPYDPFWISKPKPNIDDLWVSDMANSINDMIANGDIDPSWEVMVWDWIDKAYVTLDRIRISGESQGKWLGEAIKAANYTQNWKHVHLIAHSAGFLVINEAHKKLLEARDKGLFSGDIHLTTLDAFDPYTFYGLGLKDRYAKNLDPNRDWADNYYSLDRVTAAYTYGPFLYAHNEDLSLVDGWCNSHSFPHEWYRATATGVYPGSGEELGNDNLFNDIRYGFPRSLEVGETNWINSLAIPVGNQPSPLIDKMKSVVKAAASFIESAIDKSDTGYAITSATTLSLTTGSPVWAHTLLEIPENSNYVSFTYQFNDANEGYLTAYFNENLILVGDQRFDTNDVIESGKIYVGDILEGTNRLTFRLDPISLEDVNTSIVSIANLEIGTITNQADVDSDLTVNFMDFASFADQWHHSDCNEQNEWCQECDFDQSGTVDTNDLEVIATNWLWKPVERIKSDLNFTGKVDFADYGIFANQWMKDCQGPDWCYGCDFDKSGKVELTDLVEFAENWLTTY